MQKNNLYWLGLVVLLGASLRLVFLDRFPPSLNWDEVSLGYNAYSVLKTGRDEWGIVAPLIFRAFGDFKLPGYIYFLTPAIALFGLNALSVRLVSAVAGTLVIPLSYILAYKLFRNKKTALLSAFLMSISPWSLFLSRIAVEANLALLFAIIGVVALLRKNSVQGIIFLGLAAWTYNTFRVFSPLFIIIYSLFNFRKMRISTIHYSLFLILFLPIAVQLITTSGNARFASTTILDPGAIGKINELRARPGGRLIYNKVTYGAYIFAQNYALHFSPDYLFTKGTSHYQFSIPGQGLFFLIGLPFLYLGLLYSIHHRSYILLLMLFIAPIGASLTRDVPHTLRSIPLLPVFIIFISIGVAKSGRLISGLFVVLSLLCLGYYLSLYTTTYPKNYSWSWQYGHQDLVNFIKTNYDSYDQVIVTKKYGEPHEFINFYWPTDPAGYQSSPTKVWDYHAQWYWVDSFAKFRFVNDWEMKTYVRSLDPAKKYLIVSSPENIASANVVYTINFLDSRPAFIVSVQ